MSSPIRYIDLRRRGFIGLLIIKVEEFSDGTDVINLNVGLYVVVGGECKIIINSNGLYST